ncbi:hypothetical protein HNY73_018646 [Argiope bruennichi]|uniref:Uncharacterized protein n=1 Tax=Argiope bruennichi TaxID=94029 RepID=A0A8T0EDW5_ARGBR|nr:hypothetical protein HNY73_018646 [Argiope bruennichi]
MHRSLSAICIDYVRTASDGPEGDRPLSEMESLVSKETSKRATHDSLTAGFSAEQQVPCRKSNGGEGRSVVGICAEKVNLRGVGTGGCLDVFIRSFPSDHKSLPRLRSAFHENRLNAHASSDEIDYQRVIDYSCLDTRTESG